MFFASFAWSFVFVSLPFHIQAISTVDPVATLRWTGWILGVSSLVTVLTSPLWGRLAGVGDPKRYYLLVEVLQGLGFLGMAAARSLGELFLARLALGFMGASSTFAFILAGRSVDPLEVRRRVAAVQSAMTVGQVTGPLAGAVVAARIGFRPSFVVAAVILFGCAGLVQWGLTAPPALPGRRTPRASRSGGLAMASVIVLVGSVQLFFLPSILPQILPPLGVPVTRTVEVGGLVVFVSAAGAAMGALLTPRLGSLGSERRLIGSLLTGAAVLTATLALMPSVAPFTAVRFLQVLCVAPVFPLVVARIAQHASGGAIGAINSARIGAAFVGPVLATSLLAWGPPALLYLVLAALSIACAALVVWQDRPRGSVPA
jgi:MFS family permease